MSDQQSIVQMARRPLIALAVTVVLCIAAIWGLIELAAKVHAEMVVVQGAVSAQQEALRVKQEDLRNVRSHIQRFQALQAQGVLGEPDRPRWVEELQASQHRLGLTSPINYQLLSAKTLASLAATPEATPLAIEGVSGEPLLHELQIDLREVTEVELFDLLQDYRSHVKGRFRVQTCTLTDPKDNGLSAQCSLRFLTVPMLQPTP